MLEATASFGKQTDWGAAKEAKLSYRHTGFTVTEGKFLNSNPVDVASCLSTRLDSSTVPSVREVGLAHIVCYVAVIWICRSRLHPPYALNPKPLNPTPLNS